MKLKYTHQPETTLTITEAEQWVLTKAAIIALKTQDTLFKSDDLEAGIFTFSKSEIEALQAALEKLCPIKTELPVNF